MIQDPRSRIQDDATTSTLLTSVFALPADAASPTLITPTSPLDHQHIVSSSSTSPNSSDFELIDAIDDESPSSDDRTDEQEHEAEAEAEGEVEADTGSLPIDESGNESRNSDSDMEALYSSVRNLSKSVHANAFRPTRRFIADNRKVKRTPVPASRRRQSVGREYAGMSVSQLEEALRTSLSHLLTIAAAARARSSCCSSVISESSCGGQAQLATAASDLPVRPPVYPSLQARLGGIQATGPLRYYGGLGLPSVRQASCGGGDNVD